VVIAQFVGGSSFDLVEYGGIDCDREIKTAGARDPDWLGWGGNWGEYFDVCCEIQASDERWKASERIEECLYAKLRSWRGTRS
jgi:hypothetical protein